MDFANFGWTGVDLFFVLSGFLIASQLFEQVKQGQAISFKIFFVKRFFRIIPAYLAVVVIYFCIPYFHEKKGLVELWRFLTFTQNFGLDLSKTKAFTHSWSLCVEEHFYLALPLLLIGFQKLQLLKKAWCLLIILFVFGFITRIYSYERFWEPVSHDHRNWAVWFKYIYYPTYNRLDGLLAGVSIAAIYKFLPVTWGRISKHSHWFMITGLGILATCFFICEDQLTFTTTAFGFPLIALGYGCLVTGALSPGNFLYRWNSKVTTFIATLSYAIYLTHKGVIHMTLKWFEHKEMDETLLMTACIITCTAFALLLHWIVERPFMNLRKRVLKNEH